MYHWPNEHDGLDESTSLRYAATRPPFFRNELPCIQLRRLIR